MPDWRSARGGRGRGPRARPAPRRLLNPPGLEPTELSKRTLTNLYNARPTWLEHAHAALDRAVLAALLALNLERVPA